MALNLDQPLPLSVRENLVMQMSFTMRQLARKALPILVFIVAVAYISAVAHGVVTIDVARDLFWAIEIAQGRAWPLIGPPVGTFEVLSAIWYYVAAIAALGSSSMTAYFAWLGALAALKFVLMYRVARHWLDARFAANVVVAATLPGIGSYQLFGISHTQFVELTIWAMALFVLRLRASPTSARDALALGASAALALHAHPTAVIVLPWAAVGLLTLPARYRLRATLLAISAVIVVFLPLFVAMSAGTPTSAENTAGASVLRGSIAGLLPLLQNLFWFQSAYIVETTLPSRWVASMWLPIWILLLTLSALGALLAALDRRLRVSLWATVVTLLGVLVAVGLLRNHTPFYMLYVALVPLTVLFALGWTALRNYRFGSVVATTLASIVFVLHIAVCMGYASQARTGLIASRLPLHSDMKDTNTTTHVESASAAPTHDAVSAWLCTRSRPVALHGDLAATYDIGLGQQRFFYCPNRGVVATAGGFDNAWTGLPIPVWRGLSLAPTVTLGSYGLMPASQVISPTKSLPLVSGRAYPPRLSLMVAAASHEIWQAQFQSKSGALVVVSSLLPTYPLFSASATANGVVQSPLSQFANTVIFRCSGCSEPSNQWVISVVSGAPESTSILVLDVEGSSASLTR